MRPVERDEEPLQRQMMVASLIGFLPNIGHTRWYITTYHEQWIALLIFSAAAWKCAVRDHWIGGIFIASTITTGFNLIANNSRL